MRDEPPPELIELLSRLKLATPDQVRGVHGAARRLAHDLPLFDSVWLDALAQARVLTPYQAAEIIAGRGERLCVGPYRLQSLVQRLGSVNCYLAIATPAEGKSAGNSAKRVHLIVVRDLAPDRSEQAAAKMQVNVERFAAIKSPHIARLQAIGRDDSTLWATYEPAAGFAASQWLSCHGHLPAAAVLEIARQMTTALAELEGAGIVHGDISSSSLWLSDSGRVTLLHCAMRASLDSCGCRPELEPPLEVLDDRTPERLRDRKHASISGDIYACGCLWWHLLAGRPPIAGGDIQVKLRAGQQAEIPDIRHFALEVDQRLAAAIQQCIRPDPTQRPQSFVELMEQFGAPTVAGRRQLTAALQSSGWTRVRPTLAFQTQAVVRRAGRPLLTLAACTFLLAVATWPLWRSGKPAMERPRASPLLPVAAIVTGGNHDKSVRQVNYQTAEEHRPEAKELVATTAAPVIELSSTTETPGTHLRLQPGVVVRGPERQRARIIAPANGLVVAVDDVRFENVDFVWRHRAEAITSPDRLAIVDLRAARAKFVGCTFQAISAGSIELPAAIRLVGKTQRTAALPGAVRMELQRCTLQNVACGIECEARGPASIAIQDTLHLGHGAIVAFPNARPIDAPVAIELDHVTQRGGVSVVALNADDDFEPGGSISITTVGCVFAPDEAGALVVYSGRSSLRGAVAGLKALEWTGQGSLVAAKSPVVVWQHRGKSETLAEENVSVEGLVSSPFDFVGLASNDPAVSRLRQWLGPSHSEQSPGIGGGLPSLPQCAP